MLLAAEGVWIFIIHTYNFIHTYITLHYSTLQHSTLHDITFHPFHTYITLYIINTLTCADETLWLYKIQKSICKYFATLSSYGKYQWPCSTFNCPRPRCFPAASPLPGEFRELGAETFGGASFWQVGVDQNLQKCWYKGTKWNNNHQTWGYWPIKPTYYIPYVGGWTSILIGKQRLLGGWKPKVPGFWLTPRLATCLKMCGTLPPKDLKKKGLAFPIFRPRSEASCLSYIVQDSNLKNQQVSEMWCTTTAGCSPVIQHDATLT